MSEHTKEPWRIENSTDIFSADRRGDVNDGFQIADCSVDYDSDADPGLSHEERKANARRIVACVNACAGIATRELETKPLFSDGYIVIFEEVTKQRDELLAELKSAIEHIDFKREAYARACALIEKIEGEK